MVSTTRSVKPQDATVSIKEHQEKIRELVEMGFSEYLARSSLEK
jgi:hypothetical protein